MKKQWVTYLKFFGLLALMVFLFAFTSNRNKKRKIHQVSVEFIEEQNPYINEKTVNKLLIQNPEQVTSVGKEILVLNTVEKELDTHLMVEESDVYVTVSGELRARIKQRTPIARVNAMTPFYVDSKGAVMPLSDNYAAHVPLIYNVAENEVKEIFPLLKIIREDTFLKKHIVGIIRNAKGEYELDLRVYDFTLVLGKIQNLNSKFRNFKAFYQKALKDNSMTRYSKINLQYKNQVVCTIK
ncbi:cell division protein FtsQ/DivIB [Aquimarina brevivitae]|uniref:Cell division protein FtsQ n=1 Tax=Aquimarina brevivitae TaxID=323412 RepID=A0A4Q7NXQ4_9FLAO|nr:cell division protein FtsQ/DivIB [Aquimarina brevivitae]RZS92181.1 cell division protein FtsQ [Aquimarina brevivitae]